MSKDKLQLATGSKKHCLIAICGTSPSVVSETIYGLIKKNDPPDEVVIITTSEGENGCKEIGKAGVWDSLRELSGTKFEITYKVLQDSDGNDRDDLVDESDSRRFGDLVLNVLRSRTESGCKISFSIAGGRKSMSAIAALCMTLLGKEEDKMYHVLVSAPFDQPMEPAFYYPEPGKTHKLKFGGEEKEYRSEDAVVNLYQLQYPHIRSLHLYKLETLPQSYDSLVKSIGCKKTICVDLLERTVYFEGDTKKIIEEKSSKNNTLYRRLLLLYILASACIHGKKTLDKQELQLLFPKYCEYLKQLSEKKLNWIDNVIKQHLPGKESDWSGQKTASEISSDMCDLKKKIHEQIGADVYLKEIYDVCPEKGYFGFHKDLSGEYLKIIPAISRKDYDVIDEQIKLVVDKLRKEKNSSVKSRK